MKNGIFTVLALAAALAVSQSVVAKESFAGDTKKSDETKPASNNGEKALDNKPTADELRSEMALSGFNYKQCMSGNCDTSLSMSSNNDTGICNNAPDMPNGPLCGPAPSQTADASRPEPTQQ